MPNGKIKWFNQKKGFGFIKPDDDSNDVFVHISAFEKAGIEYLNEGEALITNCDFSDSGLRNLYITQPFCLLSVLMRTQPDRDSGR